MWAFFGLAVLVAVAVYGWFSYLDARVEARDAEVWERIYEEGKRWS